MVYQQYHYAETPSCGKAVYVTPMLYEAWVSAGVCCPMHDVFT